MDQTFNQGHTSSVASTLAALDPAPVATEAQLAHFEQLLRRRFTAEFADGRSTKWSVGVDYGPDQALAEAAVAAGMPRAKFPWKTTMWLSIKPGKCYVEVKAGYGGKFERLEL